MLDHALIGAAAKLPTSAPTPIISFTPVVLSFPDRTVDLQLRVTAPSTGNALPVVLLSHGHGNSNYLSSLEGMAPLAEFWAARGFVVIQPTHLSSKFLSLTLTAENIRDIFMDSRALDMTRILDQLDTIEKMVPLLKGRLDKTRVAVAGHSLGGLTASILLGATNTDPTDGTKTNLFESRIKAGIIFGGTGHAKDLSEAGRKRLPFYGINFSGMRTPALIVWGENDLSVAMSTGGASWHADPYTLAPAPKTSFMVKGGGHGFGGISGWDTEETDDESPERLAAVQRLTLAYLKSQLYEGDETWGNACRALKEVAEIGTVESK